MRSHSKRKVNAPKRPGMVDTSGLGLSGSESDTPPVTRPIGTKRQFEGKEERSRIRRKLSPIDRVALAPEGADSSLSSLSDAERMHSFKTLSRQQSKTPLETQLYPIYDMDTAATSGQIDIEGDFEDLSPLTLPVLVTKKSTGSHEIRQTGRCLALLTRSLPHCMPCIRRNNNNEVCRFRGEH